MGQPKPRHTNSNPRPPPDRDTNDQTKTSTRKPPKTRKKWPINASEEPDTTNTIPDNGRSPREPIIGISLPPASQAIRKSQKYVKHRLTPNQGLLYARSGITWYFLSFPSDCNKMSLLSPKSHSLHTLENPRIIGPTPNTHKHTQIQLIASPKITHN